MPDPTPPSFAPGEILTAADLNSGFAVVTPTTSGNLTPATAWGSVPALVGAGATAQNGQAQALLNRTEELNPDNQSAPATLDGTESWSIRKVGTWAKATLASWATFTAITFTIAWSAGVGAVLRTLYAVLNDLPVSVKNFGAVGDGVTLDTQAINTAQTYLATLGGGTLYFPPGTYLVDNVNTSSASWDSNNCVWILNNNIHLLGAGVGATKIKQAANANSHVVGFGQRTGGTVTVTNCSMRGIEIDGNRANQNGVVNSTDYHNAGVMVQSGCTSVVIEDFYVHDCVWYGIGMQRDGIVKCAIRNGSISNTGVDSIDWKNDSDNAYGNVVEKVTADNWGLLTTAITADPSAAFDLRSGIVASKLTAQTPGPSAVAGIRLQNGTPGATPLQPTRVHDYLVVGANVSGSAGVRVISRNCSVTDGRTENWDDGHSFSEPDCRYENLYGDNNVTSGFRFWNNASAGTLASTNQSFGLTARGNATGIICDGSISETQFHGCDVRGNSSKGYDIRTGCSNIHVHGGSSSGNGAGPSDGFNDNGTSTIIRSVSGYKTLNAVSATVAIDSTGTKSFSIAHGLPFTPLVPDVSLTLQRNTNVGDWSVGFFWVTSCDATNVNGQLRVLTASATAGALVTVVATVDSKNR